MSIKKASITQLKKALKAQPQEDLVALVVDLTKKFSVVNEYFSIMQNGEDEILEKHKNSIGKEFSPEYINFPKFRLSIARKAVLEFKKISTSPSNIAEIMVFYVECGVKGTNTFGDIDETFYDSMVSMFKSAYKHIVRNNLLESFDHRMEKIVHDTNGIGWGFHDMLYDIHAQFGLKSNLAPVKDGRY
jgi:hypothetical protein